VLIHPPERVRQYRERGWWGDVRLHDLLVRNASRVPEREALVDPPNLAEVTGAVPRRLTWAALEVLVGCLSGVLVQQGLRKDDVVVAQLANSHELVALYLACWRLGVVVSPLVAQSREHEWRHAVALTRARALIVTQRIGSHDHAHMVAQLASTFEVVPAVLAFGDGPMPAGVVDLRARWAEAERDPEGPRQALARHEAAHPVSADDAVCIIWTSGSEGRAKAVARTHNDWLLYGPQIASAYAVGDGTRFLNGRPLTTHGAFVGSLTPWLYHAGTLVNHHPFSLPVFLDQLRAERIGFTALAPAILASLLARPEQLDGVDFSALACIGSGSAPLTEALVRGFRERFGVEVINFFGSTEGASLVSAPQDMPDPALRAQYFPRFGVEGFDWRHLAHQLVQTRLVDLVSGHEITAPGQVGEMRYRGPMVMSGYLGEPELTARTFDEHGYYCSGDLFEIAGDRNQYYCFAGRAKDVIIRGGYNLSAEEIENHVASHPAVADVAVVGVPDARLGQRVCACVVLRPGAPLTLTALTRYLREVRQVSVLKLPEHLLLVGHLPRSPNNKLLKGELRQRAAATFGPQDQPARPLKETPP
jgi:acyl-CoA synthetase (AMP-forming)/AMP-acid ligase II